MFRVTVIDTETSGIAENMSTRDEALPEIIEFFGLIVDLDTGAVEEEKELLIKPRKPLPEEITKITGLTDEALVGAPPFIAVADSIRTFIETSERVIAHNLTFDRTMIDISYRRIGKPIKWPRRLICSVEQSVHLKGFRLSLTALHQHLFNEGFPAAHRARNDVMALTRCCVELRRLGEL